MLAATLLCFASMQAHAQSSIGKVLSDVLGGRSSGDQGGGQQKQRSQKQQPDAGNRPATQPSGSPSLADEEERRLNELKAALRLTPDQQSAWQSYETSVKALAYDLARAAAPNSAPEQTAPQKVDQRVDAARSRLAAMQQISESAKNLYERLSDEQKSVANKLLDGTIPPFAIAANAPDAGTQDSRKRGSGKTGSSNADQAAQAPPAQTSQANWYYCESAKTYYPYVQTCPEAWRQVPPTPQQVTR